MPGLQLPRVRTLCFRAPGRGFLEISTERAGPPQLLHDPSWRWLRPLRPQPLAGLVPAARPAPSLAEKPPRPTAAPRASDYLPEKRTR